MRLSRAQQPARAASLARLNQLVERLIYDADFREAVCTRCLDQLGLPIEERDLISELDSRELEAFSLLARREVIQRSHRGCGSLPTLFPRAVSHWLERHPVDRNLDALASAFTASPHFRRYREVPYAGQGICLEEAFHHFCEDQELADPQAREREFLMAMIKALSSSPNASFSVPGIIRAAPNGYFAIGGPDAAPILYATSRGQLLCGRITPLLKQLLLGEIEPARTDESSVVGAATRELQGLGLLAPRFY